MNKDELAQMLTEQNEAIEKIKEQPTHNDLKEFYLSKYQEMYQEILTNRVNEIDEEMKKIDLEIEKLNESVSRIDDTLQANEITKQKISDVEARIYECYGKMEEQRFTSETVCYKIQNETVELCKEHLMLVQPWFNTLKQYYDGLITNGELIEAINHLTKLMHGKCYDLSIKIKQNELENRRLEDKLNDKVAEIRKQLDSLLKEKERYENYILDISVEHQESVKHDLELRLEHKQNYLKEIKEIYSTTSTKQLKEFTELYSKNYLVSKPASEQVEEYDALFIKFKSRLLCLDTKTNLEYQRNKRLKDLKEEKKRLDVIKEQKEHLDVKIKRYQEAYLIIQTTIKELDNHVLDIKDNIAGFKHQQFIRFDDQFRKELKDGMNAIKQQQKVLEGLKEDRTFMLFEPEVEKIRNIDNQIHQEELTLNQLINKYDGIQKDYEEFLSQNDNGKIKELLDEGQYFEEKIPQLKEMMLKLEDKINGFIDDSQRLNNQLVDYQNVIMQIEELLNENYD